MINSDEMFAIHERIKRLSGQEIREKVRSNPAIQERIAEIRALEKEWKLPVFPISDESMVYERRDALLGKIVRREITEDEHREYVELNCIISELRKPEPLRARSRQASVTR